MKKIKLLLFSVALILAASFVSCSNDDEAPDPDGTIALNMLNEDNGKIILGYSDIYIDSGNNFYSSSCLLSSLGPKNGLGDISGVNLSGAINSIAVESGNAYQVFSVNGVKEFPSGKRALHINANYYNVYVLSLIKQDKDVIGAKVKFAIFDAPGDDIPSYRTEIGTMDSWNNSTWEIRVDLPTSDFEVVKDFDRYVNSFSFISEGNQLIVRMDEYEGYNGIYYCYLRVGSVYTYIYFVVE